MRRPEQTIHRAVVAHLKARAAPDLFWTHVPSGAFFGSPRQGAIMKSLGWKTGVPDLIAIHEGRTYALELKAEGGKPSPKQIETIAAMQAAGAITGVAVGLDEALRWLESHNLLRGRAT
jgi:hypothetical protein